jgi:nucleotide-binding universal stress UspA family protein
MYSRILVPLDGSTAAQCGFQEARKLARAVGATVKVINVVCEFPLNTGYVPAVYEQMLDTLREAGSALTVKAAGALRQDRVAVHSEVVETIGESVADCIVRQATQWGADLIVMGTHGRRGLKRLALGSDAEIVLRTSSVPVLLVRENEASATTQADSATTYHRILVPVDGSSTSLEGLGEALKLAKSCQAQVRIVHVVDELIADYGYSPALYTQEMVEALRESGTHVLDAAANTAIREGVETSRQLIETIGGRAADAIVAAATQWSADLIVMGTHGRRGLKRLTMGSDTEMVLRSSQVPVLVVRRVSAIAETLP